jgi:hypothetical protein
VASPLAARAEAEIARFIAINSSLFNRINRREWWYVCYIKPTPMQHDYHPPPTQCDIPVLSR